jgi:hypothetical protein
VFAYPAFELRNRSIARMTIVADRGPRSSPLGARTRSSVSDGMPEDARSGRLPEKIQGSASQDWHGRRGG